jgi:hypothetical protein
MKSFISMGAIAVALMLAACKKDETTTTAATTNSLTLNFEHVWGTDSSEFALGTDLVHPVTGDSLNFTTLKYYVSNIRLKKLDGSYWTQSDSYYLVDLSTTDGGMLTLTGVPVGEYTEIEYTLGVDSTHNVSGAQSGALSTSYGMFWSWNTGYIMTKAEGTTPDNSGGSFSYHLGGFSGTNNVVTVKTHAFTGNNLNITATNEPAIHLIARPETLWSTIGSVSGTATVHMPGATAKTIADDFNASFNFEHIHE